MQSLRLALTSMLLLVPALPAGAHRLDELLQATYVAVGAEQTRIELHLAVGAEVAGQIRGLVDRDRDGAMSAAERERFVIEHLAQVDLTIDGRRQRLTLGRHEFPDDGALAAGVGVIRVTGVTAAPGEGRHALVVTNRTVPAISVYQANALQPQTDKIEIVAQSRDLRQQTLRVDYTVAEAPLTTAAIVWISTLGGAALLAVRGIERWRARAVRPGHAG